MLEFSAIEFIDLSHKFGILLGQYRKNPNPNVLGDTLSTLLVQSKRLGLRVTHTQINDWIVEIIGTNPKHAAVYSVGEGRRIQITDVTLDPTRAIHHVEMLYSTMVAEMRSILFRAIPSERTPYCDPGWLAETAIPIKFPVSLRELQLGGSCYALGQPTASVFHSMRALEPGLAALADKFNRPHAQGNWQTLIEGIESDIRALGGQAKSQQKLEDEKFFGAAASHLYFVKNAWRNHVAHTRDSYSDDEALRVLRSTSQFIESLCSRLQEPSVP
jgi:hypothetical protein